MGQRAAGGFGLIGRKFQNRVGAFHHHRDRLADRFLQILVEIGEILARFGGLDGDLGQPVPGVAIDGDTGAVGAAIRHGHEHIRQHGAQFGFKRFVFQEQSDNAAHDLIPLLRFQHASSKVSQQQL